MASLCTKPNQPLGEEWSPVRGGRTVISMKKVEAIFITSRLDTVRELLSQRCGLDIAMSRANEPPDRGQAVLLPELPLVRLEAFVSDVQAMPMVQVILQALRNAPGIDVVSIGVSKVNGQAPRLRESLPLRAHATDGLRAA